MGIFSKDVEKQNCPSCGARLHPVVLINQGHLNRTTRSSSHLAHRGSILTKAFEICVNLSPLMVSAKHKWHQTKHCSSVGQEVLLLLRTLK